MGKTKKVQEQNGESDLFKRGVLEMKLEILEKIANNEETRDKDTNKIISDMIKELKNELDQFEQ